MNLTHLHIHVADRAAAETFYRDWFGLVVDRRFGQLTFLTDTLGFELALMDDANPAPMPPWFHFGFRLESKNAVIELNQKMTEKAVSMVKPLYQDDTLVSFRCADLDGYPIEIYWEANKSLAN
jgi:catechol-2,3-dioxygenase